MNQVYQRVAGNRPGRSVFDLSHDVKFTCDMGELIPVLHQHCVPGDVMSIANQVVIRFQPMVAPILHEINAYCHYFFVPYRLIWSDWESFITGGVDGTEAPTLPVTSGPISANSIEDYMGLPVGITFPAGFRPLSFGKYAYNLVYNEYYRDETLVTEVALTDGAIKKRAWEKDYFTSALPWQQRGTAPALPISLSGVLAGYGTGIPVAHVSTDTTPRNLQVGASAHVDLTGATGTGNFLWDDPKIAVDTSTVTATSFDIADLRLAVQIQKFLERNARAGARYTEFLQAHFGASPRDDRLQRPEYLGGSKSPVIVSEVLQTSSTDGTSPQANMAGHGIAVDRRHICKYRAQEYGVIIGILSVMPRSLYQQGIEREFLRSTRYDFYFPEFANLSEQPVYRGEIYASAVLAENQTVFGYQGRYNEMRARRSYVASDMRATYDYWHLSRQFSSAPALNQTFIECTPRKDFLAAPSPDAMIVSMGNIIRAVRPLPIVSNPGLIDH